MPTAAQTCGTGRRRRVGEGKGIRKGARFLEVNVAYRETEEEVREVPRLTAQVPRVQARHATVRAEHR